MKIARINIQSFRGIPESCSLDFRDKRGNVCSAIIYGGNGCGKSSIVDAIEYNLQGRIERSEKILVFRRPSAQCMSYIDYKDAFIEIEFDDGSINKRAISFEYDNKTNLLTYERIPDKAHPVFRFSPIVLRRNDIISFNMCEVAQKQVLLSQFFYDFSTRLKVENDPVVLENREKLLGLKNQRRDWANEIVNITKFSGKEINQGFSGNFLSFIKARVAPIGDISFSKGKTLKKTLHSKDYQKVIELAENITKISEDIKKYNRIISLSKPKRNDSGREKFEVLNKDYEKSGKYLSAAFKEITNADYVDRINLSIANRSITSFEIEVTLVNGATVPPESIFSEANYDLMILLLYVSMIRVSAEKGQEKVLVLDDVLQSVDATIRTKFMSYILREFCDWQLFITCHDRAWLNQLRHLFNTAKGGYHPFKEFDIVRWSFDRGPVIQVNNAGSKDNRLEDALRTNNISVIASTSGPFFEMICEKLSGFLNCQINRNPEDRYTIGDLWKGVKKELLNIGLDKEVKDIDDFLFVRNMIGCHYSTWAEETSDYEIICFATAVQTLYDKTFCGKEGCMSWISGKWYEVKKCNCGNLYYMKKK